MDVPEHMDTILNCTEILERLENYRKKWSLSDEVTPQQVLL